MVTQRTNIYRETLTEVWEELDVVIEPPIHLSGEALTPLPPLQAIPYPIDVLIADFRVLRIVNKQTGRGHMIYSVGIIAHPMPPQGGAGIGVAWIAIEQGRFRVTVTHPENPSRSRVLTRQLGAMAPDVFGSRRVSRNPPTSLVIFPYMGFTQDEWRFIEHAMTDSTARRLESIAVGGQRIQFQITGTSGFPRTDDFEYEVIFVERDIPCNDPMTFNLEWSPTNA